MGGGVSTPQMRGDPSGSRYECIVAQTPSTERAVSQQDGYAAIKKCWCLSTDDVHLDQEPACIWSGAHASVHCAIHCAQPVVAKILATPQPRRQAELLERELHALSRLQDCPNIVRLHGWTRLDHASPVRVHGDAYVLVMARAVRDLRDDLLRPTSAMRDTRTLLGVARAMRAVHDARLAHLDLNTSNVLLAADDTPWLCDFGLCATYDELAASPREVGRRGTLTYHAPEIFTPDSPSMPLAGCECERFGLGLDVYAFAVLAWSVLAREEPWEGVPAIAIQMSVRAGERPGGDTNWQDAWRKRGGSLAVVELIDACWHPRAAERPAFDDITARLEASLVETDQSEQ